MKYFLIAVLGYSLAASSAFASNATCESNDKSTLIVLKNVAWDPNAVGPVNASANLLIVKIGGELTYAEYTLAGSHENMMYDLNDGHSDYSVQISDLARDPEEIANQVTLTPRGKKSVSLGCFWI